MKIKIWQNGLGCVVTSGRLIIEVWEHGGVQRQVRDNSLCGVRGTHYTKVPKGTLEEMAAAALDAWKNRKNTWQECE